VNVEFLAGVIESIPLPDACVDVVISNCVINLAGDKAKVLAEAARVLRPGGRFAVSDVIADPDMDAATRADMAAYTGCIAGALTEHEFRAALRRDPIALLLAAQDGKLTARLLPDVKDNDGTAVLQLEISASDLNPIVLDVDRDTLLIRKQSYRADAPGRPLVEESFSDYRPIDGIQIAFRASRKSGPLVVERRVTDVKINTTVEPALFTRPAS
jgi:SAM-dependent methyltransferase